MRYPGCGIGGYRGTITTRSDEEMMNVRTVLQQIYPGLFIVEVVDLPADLGIVDIELIVPEEVPCPTGTVQQP